MGITLFYRRPEIARSLIFLSFVLLWLAATPFFADSALHLIEAQTTPLNNYYPQAQAIIILGGGTYSNAPEYAGEDTVSEATLARLRYGARLERKFNLPILVTGGNPAGDDTPEAWQMRVALQHDFGVPVRWIEENSNNTFENAQNSFKILDHENIRTIYLVTHAWHMPRSAAAFKLAGFNVIEAPTAYTTRHSTNLLTFVPRAEALRESSIFCHEIIGLLWYRIKSVH
jgi:uncharacterized SAM-binding protein YcdF (DUF218 family)